MQVYCPGWFGVKHDQPVRLEDKPGAGTGHGMCPACSTEANRQMDELEKAKGAPK
jgi:hypothetical protein